MATSPTCLRRVLDRRPARDSTCHLGLRHQNEKQRAEAQSVSVLHLSSGAKTRLPWPGRGTWDLRARSPAFYGPKRKSQIRSICDFGSSQECSGPRNRSSPCYKPSSSGATLRQQLCPLECALSSTVQLGLAGFASESKSEDTSGAVSRQG